MSSARQAASRLRLTSDDAISLLLRSTGFEKLPSSATILLNSSSSVDSLSLRYAALLHSHFQNSLSVVSPDAKTSSQARSLGITNLHQGRTARDAALTALETSSRFVILPDDIHDAAHASLTTFSGMLAPTTHHAPGTECLPPGAITFARPLINLPVEDGDGKFRRKGSTPFLNPIDLRTAIRHGKQRAHCVASLREASDSLLRQCVLEASHWGYIVVSRRTLSAYYNSSSSTSSASISTSAVSDRLIALDALSRLITHVCGADTPLSPDNEHVARLAQHLLSLPLKPLPKGRTAAGMIVRPATGRFARRVLQEARRSSMLQKDVNVDVSTDFRVADELMILTREPDHESSGLAARRLRGNWACVPVGNGDGTRNDAVYWDNRFVILTGKLDDLRNSDSDQDMDINVAPTPRVDELAVLRAALRSTKATGLQEGADGGRKNAVSAASEAALRETELYVRQLRRSDWERITAATERVRVFQTPFECIRALPAIFEKSKGEMSTGQLCSSPHLGLCARTDLYFTAVRLPRFRSLPWDIEPGFVMPENEAHLKQARHELSRRRQIYAQRIHPNSRNPTRHGSSRQRIKNIGRARNFKAQSSGVRLQYR